MIQVGGRGEQRNPQALFAHSGIYALQVDIILPVWYYDTSGVVGGRCEQRNPPVLFVVCRLLRPRLRLNALSGLRIMRRAL